MFENTLKTFTLLAGLAGFFVVVGTLLGGVAGLVIGGLFGFGLVGCSYWFSDRLAVKSARAQKVRPGEFEWLQSDLVALADRAGMVSPRLFISPDDQPNAVATGRNERTAIVCVTAGLLSALDRDELRRVVAHEVAHVKHRDILIGSIAAAVATGISILANLAMFTTMFGGGSDDEDSPNPFVLMAAALVAPMAAALVQMALSRSREFDADRLGSELLGDLRPLASALVKLDRSAQRVAINVSPSQATAYIVNPLTGREAKFSNLFSTYRPTVARVQRLLADHRVVAVTQ